MMIAVSFFVVKLQNEDTALIFAAERGHASCVKMLVDAGADMDVQAKVHFDFSHFPSLISSGVCRRNQCPS